MKYNELILTRQKDAKRAGRGISAGRGKTAGRGTKGQGSRKSPVRFGFEGGQNPLYARLPKLRGFKSYRMGSETVYTSQLDTFTVAKIDNKALFEAGLITSAHTPVKLLFKGNISVKKDVHLQSASANAVKAIEKAGGSFSTTARIGRPVTSAKRAAKSAQ
jgi:large subunit ribosomal protein L15